MIFSILSILTVTLPIFYWHLLGLCNLPNLSLLSTNLIKDAILNSFFLALIINLCILILSFIYSYLLIFSCSLVKKHRSLLYTSVLFNFAFPPLVLVAIIKETPVLSPLPQFVQLFILLFPQLFSFYTLIFLFIIQKSFSQSSLNFFYLSIGNKHSLLLKEILLPKTKQWVFLFFFLEAIHLFFKYDIPSVLGIRSFGENCLSFAIISYSPIKSLGFFSLSDLILPLFLLVAFLLLKSNTEALQFSYSSLSISKKNKCTSYTKRIICFFSLYFSIAIFILIAIYLYDKNTSFSNFLNITQMIISTLTIIIIPVIASLTLSHFIYNKLIRTNTKSLKIFFSFSMLLLLFTPEPMIAIGTAQLFTFFNMSNFFIDWLKLFLGYFYYVLPIAWFMQLVHQNDYIDQFSNQLQISLFSQFKEIFIPRMFHIWIAEVLLLVIWSLNSLNIPLLLTPVGHESLILRIYNLLHYGAINEVILIGLMVSLILALITLIITSMLKPER